MPAVSCEVAITGIGVVSPIGNSYKQFSENYLTGQHAFALIDSPVSVNDVSFFGSPVRHFTCPDILPSHLFRRLDRSSQLAISSFSQAWTKEHAGHFPSDRIGVIFSTGLGGLSTLCNEVINLSTKGPARVSPYTVAATMPCAAAAHLSSLATSHGWVESPSSACSGGAQSIYRSIELLSRNEIDVAICGASEAIVNKYGLAAFNAMGVIPQASNTKLEDACAPFDQNRQGFYLSEGSVVLILERASSADKRGADIFGRILSGSMTFDCHDIVSLDPSGEYAYQSMRLALQSSGRSLQQIQLLKAHATGTKLGDLAEARAIARLYSDVSPSGFPVLSAPKSFLGHFISVSGPIELLTALTTLETGILPPHPSIKNPMPELPFYPSSISSSINTRQSEPPAALLNTFGFGGTNISIVVESTTNLAQ